MRQFISSMSSRARFAFAFGVIVIVAVMVGATWWTMHPTYGVLFRDLRESDAAEITTALAQMQEPYRLADEGKTILVPSDDVYASRMKLVSQGVPKGGSVGFELFKDSDYGVTEFAQKVNFQRALQGELERTIDSLAEVISARVHLTIHRSGLFEKEQEASKASVTVTLQPQKHLDARQVAGIQRLVASAVEGLSPESVAVLDDKGIVLSGYASDGEGTASVSDRLDEQTKLESDLRVRVAQILHRVLLEDDFTVSVDVRLNYDHVKHLSERLVAQGKDGNGLLVREKVDASGHGTDVSDPEHPKSGPTSNNREVEYAHGREQEEVERAPGAIDRISVGIVIPATMPKTELSKLTDVVSAGLGLDASRGDKVDIAAIAAPEVANKTPATTVVSSNASTEAIAVDGTPDTSVVAAAASTFPWAYALIGALLLLIVFAGGLALGRPKPRRLLGSEREETLAQLRRWIESTEASP